MEYIKNDKELSIINIEPLKKNESKRWLSPKKLTALFVGSLSLTAVGVKAFDAQDLDSDPAGTPLEISVDTTPDSTSPESTIPDTTPDSTSPESTIPDTTPDSTSPDNPTTEEPNYTEPEPQDIFGDICSPMGWGSCGEYNIYDSEGNIVNRVIADDSWTPEYINSISGGSDSGSAEKIRDINPVETP